MKEVERKKVMSCDRALAQHVQRLIYFLARDK
jgi:hypothetical protein